MRADCQAELSSGEWSPVPDGQVYEEGVEVAEPDPHYVSRYQMKLELHCPSAPAETQEELILG